MPLQRKIIYLKIFVYDTSLKTPRCVMTCNCIFLNRSQFYLGYSWIQGRTGPAVHQTGTCALPLDFSASAWLGCANNWLRIHVGGKVVILKINMLSGAPRNVSIPQTLQRQFSTKKKTGLQKWLKSTDIS